ncbi:proteasome subunit beta [Spongiactinospora rosea]|uniref:Proteasome subunit beta n=2 Tax=Spongiactinospora rosea TaxID=2248750 RepID=A0A366M6R5_9ACTN|nr:proteasome subunit beta [Spongiactinospora rosea]
MGPGVEEPSFFSHHTSSFLDLMELHRAEQLPWNRVDEAGTEPLEIPHGTTVLAAAFPGGVVMAGDRRATSGNMIVNRELEKVAVADEFSLIAYAGAVGIAVELIRLFRFELQHYEKVQGRTLSTSGKANRLASMVRANLPAATMGMAALPLYAAYDEAEGRGRIFSYDVGGGPFEEGDFHALGSGSVFARGALKKLYRPDLTESELARACVEALYDAADDDTATGGPDTIRHIYPVLTVATAEGARRYTDEEAAAVARTVVDARLANPLGPTAG